MSEDYLNVDTEAESGTGPAIAALLSTVAQTLQEAPDGYRYDLVLKVNEHTPDGGA